MKIFMLILITISTILPVILLLGILFAIIVGIGTLILSLTWWKILLIGFGSIWLLKVITQLETQNGTLREFIENYEKSDSND